MSKYSIETTVDFDKEYKRIYKKDKQLAKRISRTVEQIAEDPFYKSLSSHKVNTRNYDNAYSSRVSGDMRIIWNFSEENKLVIIILTLGGHSGKHAVYS